MPGSSNTHRHGQAGEQLDPHIERIGKVSITSYGFAWFGSRKKMRDLMSLRLKYFNILSGMVPAGALGVSLLLGSAAPCDAGKDPSNPLSSATRGVSERLAAIREAVSELGAPSTGSSEG